MAFPFMFAVVAIKNKNRGMTRLIEHIFVVIALMSCSILHAMPLPSDYKAEGIKLSQLLFYAETLYVDTVNVTHLSETAINAILKELDPHCSYIPLSDVESMNEAVHGNFEGIGIAYGMINDTIVVSQTITGCPAEKAGVLPGDRIISVDTVAVAGVNIKQSQIPKLLRGPKGSSVEIGVIRRGEKELLHFKITRDKIPIYSVDAAFYPVQDVAYIKLNSFSGTTTAEIADALKRLAKDGDMKALVIDLQGNGGGVMSAAIELVNLFLPDGRLIVYTQGEHQKRQDALSFKTKRKKTVDIPLYVLVDEYSASASEIVSGALQDWDRATIVGRRTFGKGLVQRPIRFYDGSELRLTVSRYYTPSGRNIQKPYDGGSDKYYKEIEARYKHGEFTNADSVSFPDSLKYKTLVKGRTVYGGGGIFPDIFVPLDTAKYTKYHRSVVARGIFNRVVRNYIDDNRRQIKVKYPTFNGFETWFQPDNRIIERIREEADKEGVEYNEDEFSRSEKLMLLQIKALVAQSVYGTEYYFRIMYTQNDALTYAIDLINSHKTL